MSNSDRPLDEYPPSIQALFTAFQQEQGEETEDCLSRDQINKFVQRKGISWLPSYREQWSHVVHCPHCRQIYLGLKKQKFADLLANSRRPVRQTKALNISAAGFATAVILLVLYVRPFPRQFDAGMKQQYQEALLPDQSLNENLALGETKRGTSPEVTKKYPVALTQPVGCLIADEYPRLEWKKFPHALSYTVEVRNQMEGTQVFSKPVTDTAYAVKGRPLDRGTVYMWQVTAHLPEGKTVQSVAVPFAVLDEAKYTKLKQLQSEIGSNPNSSTRLWLAGIYETNRMFDEALQELRKIPIGDTNHGEADSRIRKLEDKIHPLKEKL